MFERLWTPWRYWYVSRGVKQKGCFLCNAAREKKDDDNLVIYRGKKCFVVLNRFPYNNGHVMVAPYRHVSDLSLLEEDEFRELWDLVRVSVEALRKAYSPDGFNIGINLGRVAGAGLPGHLHVHIVPRWEGDTNFMPVVGETKTMPEDLTVSLSKIRKAFRELLRDGEDS